MPASTGQYLHTVQSIVWDLTDGRPVATKFQLSLREQPSRGYIADAPVPLVDHSEITHTE